tara:strand:- start:380 stop:934 length:555 start_codon:yes stop_codon:yes gene_type:complete
MKLKFQTILLILLFTVKVNASDLGELAKPEDDVAPEHSWTRTFVLKDGRNTITHKPDEMVIGRNFHLQCPKFISTVGSSISGLKIEDNDLVLSTSMTYDEFVKALVTSKIYEDKPENWRGEFECSEGVKIIHMPQGVILEKNGETVGFKFLTLGSNPDHTLTGLLSYDVFVGMLEASGYYKHPD